MKPKTEELLYLLLWSSEWLCRPTWRNLTESFEGWTYRNGLHRQLARLEGLKLVASKPSAHDGRVHRLTEAGRLWALGGREPEAYWQRHWDGRWRAVLFDVPSGEDSARNRLRESLRRRGFGYLQNSVWITPDPLMNDRKTLTSQAADVESLIVLEARPCAGESDMEIVAGAWDFAAINAGYAKHAELLGRRPLQPLLTEADATVFRRWAREEHQAWDTAVGLDPLLPACLLPPGYLGRKAVQKRRDTLAQAAEQMRGFKFAGVPK
ncbi:MAG: hypothetical protein ACYDH9_11835 [Limisphaerales bacterium]